MPDVAFARRALGSLLSYDRYLRARNTAAADGLAAEIARTCELLATFPAAGRREPTSGLRVHITKKYRYRIVYRPSETGIEILDVLHPARR